MNVATVNAANTVDGAAVNNFTARWSRLYNQIPLCDVPRHYAAIRNSPFLMQYLQTILRLCPRGGRTLETGVGSGYGAIWLSRRGCRAEGIDLSSQLVQRAAQINNMLSGGASFATGDLFQLYADRTNDSPLPPSYDVIHHQGVLEHFTVPQIRSALAQQVALAHHVVFSVPSVHYPFDPEFGDERLLPLDEWERILEPFSVAELRYYGDPRHGEKEHVLAVLRGEKITPQLLERMELSREAYPEGISAIVHTRNEAARINECLQSLQGWTDEIIVCDMESTDATVEIARHLGATVIHHPLISNFDRARNASAMRAAYRWIFYLDADERVPSGLAQALKQISRDPHADLAALLIPFRHHFAGHWMRSLYPGYTMPRLFRNGCFYFAGRLHGGAQVDGKTVRFPADNPELALVHYSYDSLAHYLDKLNRYTDGEAANMHRDGHAFHWQQAIRHWVQDFASYYDQQGARQDGVHGWIYSFLSAFYRFEQHAKLYEKRQQAGQLHPSETAVPASVEEVLEYALSILREKPLPQVQPISVVACEASAAGEADTACEVSTEESANNDSIAKIDGRATADAKESGSQEISTPQGGASRMALPVVWSGPLLDPSGYGEESRQFLFGLDELLKSDEILGSDKMLGADEVLDTEGVSRNGHKHNPDRLPFHLAAQVLPWNHDVVELTPKEEERLQALCRRRVDPGFIHITQNFPLGIGRHPQADTSIGRTMFETDRLPLAWVKACNRLDSVWVPTEFNRQTFADAGVLPEKLTVIPGCLNAELYREEASLDAEAQHRRRKKTPSPSVPFVFLTMFDWTLHKGWDVLLHSFLQAFEGRDDVALVFKVWSTMGYSPEQIQKQAADLVREALDHDLALDRRVRFVFDRLPAAALRVLFRDADAFVLPSRGEGWGRPYMEAMACGLPTIGTNWSGNTAFMTADNSYLLRNNVVPIPERGWREIPTYQGHRWAEPDQTHLIEILQQVTDDREAANDCGKRAREEVLARYDRRIVARTIVQELGRIKEARCESKRASVSARLETSNGLSNTSDIGHENHETSQPDLVHRVPATDETAGTEKVNPLTVRWEGAQFCWHSLGLVNRELSLQLIINPGIADGMARWGEVASRVATAREHAPGNAPADETPANDSSTDRSAVELSLVPTEPAWFAAEEDPRFAALEERVFAPLSKPAQVHVRHFYPPRFERPEEGQLVLMQPWEYGLLPASWVEPIRQNVDEVWCYSEYVRQVYRDSGVPDEKLQIVPLGVDTTVFHPEAPPYVFHD